MVLNALEVDPGRPWISPSTGKATVWRWFSDEMLDCCESLEAVRRKGIDMDKIQCMATCNGAGSEMKRANDNGVAAFRKDVKAACGAAPTGRRRSLVMASYCRKVLGQTGGGHFSPLAAFNEKSDAVLVMDVARFKYKPHWIPVQALWEAMLPVDNETGKSRGWYVMWKAEGEHMLTINCKDAEGRDTVHFLLHLLNVQLPGILLSASLNQVEGAWQQRLQGILQKDEWREPLRHLFLYFEGHNGDSCALLSQVRATEVFRSFAVNDLGAPVVGTSRPQLTQRQCSTRAADFCHESGSCLVSRQESNVPLTEALALAIMYVLRYADKDVIRDIRERASVPEEVLDDILSDDLCKELEHVHRQVKALALLSCSHA